MVKQQISSYGFRKWIFLFQNDRNSYLFRVTCVHSTPSFPTYSKNFCWTEYNFFKVYELQLRFRIFEKNSYIFLISPTLYLFPGYVTIFHFSHICSIR